jgi:membrane-associated phospholipid phosphatase
MGIRERSRRRWEPIDGIVVAYTVWTGLLIVCFSPEAWPWLLAAHAAIVASVLIIPPRGAAWERREWPGRGGRAVHELLRFLRHAYPLPLALFLFEEGRFTVNMIFPANPYWFEPHLYAADAAVFGDLPARLLAPWVGPPLTELMHFFYWSYYTILIGGVLLAYLGPARLRGPSQAHGSAGRLGVPAEGFATVITSLGAAFIAAFVFYPLLPARGPWESPGVMAGLPPLEGYAFTAMMDFIIEHGAVSGNCFPSAHVAGAWAIVLGLWRTPAHRREAWGLALLAAAMSVACVFTRYHHAADVAAGLACGIAGALAARRLA